MGALDIIIPLGLGSQYKNWELRYSLRSIEKYHPWTISNLFIVGVKPDFLTGVKYIRCSDTNHKQFNIANKVLQGCRHEDCADTVLYTNDDFFFNATAYTLPDYFDGTVEEWSKKDLNMRYATVVRNSAPGLYFDVHTPMMINRDEWISMMQQPWGKDHLVKSGYKNTYATNPVYLKDCKIRDEQIPSGPFFSTPDKMSNQLMRKIQDLYPIKSRWEK